VWQQRKKETNKQRKQHNKLSTSEELGAFPLRFPVGVCAPDCVSEAVIILIWYVQCKRILCFSNLVNWHVFLDEPSSYSLFCGGELVGSPSCNISHTVRIFYSSRHDSFAHTRKKLACFFIKIVSLSLLNDSNFILLVF